METERSWEAPRDGLLAQLSCLLSELHAHEEGNTSSVDLLDHLDGTRRAIDRLSATITDKYIHPSSVEFFSPAVSRPLSTATDASNSSSEKSFESLESRLTNLSSPTTLISEYDDDLNHRRRLLDEDEDILIGRSQLNDDNDDEAEESMHQDQDERFERLSLLLTSVLKEANEAIRDYEAVDEEVEVEAEMELPNSRCSSRLSTAASTMTGSIELSPIDGSLKTPMYSLPALHSQETIRPMLQPPTAPPTPPPSADNSGFLPSPDQLSISSLTSSTETVRPTIHLSRPEEDEELVIDMTELATLEKESLIDDLFLDSPKELSLDYLLGDYLNEVIMDVRRSEFVGARFWIFLLTITGMWSWMFVTNWISSIGCACRNIA